MSPSRGAVAVAISGAVALAIARRYRLPRPRATTQQLYADVDPATASSLQAFRTTHPVRRLTLHGHTWEYVSVGHGPATVVFLHGMSGAHDIWWQQLEALSDSHRTIAVTYPPVATLSELADGLLAILDAVGADTAAIVGSSLGGYLAQYLVQHHPERIDRAVFANTFPPNDQLRDAHRWRARAGRLLPERLVAAAFRASNTHKVLPASQGSPLVAAYLAEQARLPGLKQRLLARYRTVVEPFTIRDPTPEGLPLLLLQSDNDPLLEPRLRAALVTTYPTAQVHTFTEGGHFPYLDRPAAYTEVLRGFLA
ncbi:MAG: alpha/beta hydrolase [Nitriliruptoraceae bacterium]